MRRSRRMKRKSSGTLSRPQGQTLPPRRHRPVPEERPPRRSSDKAKFDSKPGQHGRTSGPRTSDFGLQLREKQKVKRMYGVLERQFRRYFAEADRRKGNTGANLLVLLESRLDNVVYRMGFGSTRAEARQLVSHKAITVNGEVGQHPVVPGQGRRRRSRCATSRRSRRASPRRCSWPSSRASRPGSRSTRPSWKASSRRLPDRDEFGADINEVADRRAVLAITRSDGRAARLAGPTTTVLFAFAGIRRHPARQVHQPYRCNEPRVLRGRLHETTLLKPKAIKVEPLGAERAQGHARAVRARLRPHARQCAAPRPAVVDGRLRADRSHDRRRAARVLVDRRRAGRRRPHPAEPEGRGVQAAQPRRSHAESAQGRRRPRSRPATSRRRTTSRSSTPIT